MEIDTMHDTSDDNMARRVLTLLPRFIEVYPLSYLESSLLTAQVWRNDRFPTLPDCFYPIQIALLSNLCGETAGLCQRTVMVPSLLLHHVVQTEPC